MRVDKAFDSWLDENCLFCERYGLPQLHCTWCMCVCVNEKIKRKKRESELVLAALIPASQPVLRWPEPRFIQPDD